MESILPLSLQISRGLVLLGMLFAVIRLIRGPTLADRAVALDLLAVQAIMFLAIHAIQTDEELFVDVILAVIGLGFLVMIAAARTIELAGQRWKELD